MRILTLGAAAAGLTLAGGALIGPAVAQTYYVPAPAYAPAPAYVVPGAPVAPGYYSYYDADGNLVTGVAASPLGTVLAPAYGATRVDRFGPDPNGMIAPDGHRIKCKLSEDWNDYRGRYITRRICD